MYQSIAISHGIINNFCKDYKNWADASGLLSREKEIHVASDFNVNLAQIVSDIPNQGIADLVQITFDGILGNIKYADNSDTLSSIVTQALDKILVSEKARLNSFKNINVVRPELYINPDKNVPVANPRKIVLNNNEKVHPEKIIAPYIKLSKTVKIMDPYPLVYYRNKFSPYRVFSDLVTWCKPGTRIIIISVSDTVRSKKLGSKFYKVTEKMIRKELSQIIPKDLKIEFRFRKENIKDREIITDQFYIQMGHGLGMFRYRNGEYHNGSGDGATISIMAK